MNPVQAADKAKDEHRDQDGPHDIWPTFNGGWLCLIHKVSHGINYHGYTRLDEEPSR